MAPLCVAALMGLCLMPMDKTAQVHMYVCMYVCRSILYHYSIVFSQPLPSCMLLSCQYISNTVLIVMCGPGATNAHSLYVFMYISGIPLPILQTLMSAQMGQTIVSIPAPTHLAPLCVAVTLALRWMPMESTAQVGAWPSSQSMLPPR